jgi:predicted nucleic acid-binding protein
MESPQILIDTSIYLKSKNQLISPPDIFIAATAISYNLSLVTLNKLQKAAARNRFRDA